MGYESRIYVMNVHKGYSICGKPYAERIAVFDLCCMGSERRWEKLFQTPVDYDIYATDGNTVLSEDNYGDSLMSASLADVISCLEELETKEHYRRIPPLLNMLKGFDPAEWDQLQCVHYGY